MDERGQMCATNITDSRRFRRIEPEISDHFKVLFRIMENELFNKFNSRNSFGNGFVVFIAGIVKSNILAIIAINSGGGNGRTSKISANIFNDVRVRRPFMVQADIVDL